MAEERVLEEVILAPHAVKRLIEPEEVADVVSFLLGPERARAFTGRPGDDGPRLDRPLRNSRASDVRAAGLVREVEVSGARPQRQPGAGDGAGEPLAVGRRDHAVLLAVHHQRGPRMSPRRPSTSWQSAAASWAR